MHGIALSSVRQGVERRAGAKLLKLYIVFAAVADMQQYREKQDENQIQHEHNAAERRPARI